VEEIHDVFLICTTNRPDIVDPAFIRSGRVEYQFFMDRSDHEAREEIFKVHLS
jgi:transitional endoplasmic reticulum ATPase